jgi:hypothetical protein
MTSPFHLQLYGQLASDDGHCGYGPPAPIGLRTFLQPGTFSLVDELLGPTNRSMIPLPPDLIDRTFILRRYQFFSAPDGGQLLHDLPLVEPLSLEQPNLPALPPGAIRLDRDRQPIFTMPQKERNPCPGWAERIHLYENPGSPFETSAVLYLNQDQSVAAAELFNVQLRRWRPGVGNQQARRCWIQFTY